MKQSLHTCNAHLEKLFEVAHAKTAWTLVRYWKGGFRLWHAINLTSLKILKEQQNSQYPLHLESTSCEYCSC